MESSWLIELVKTVGVPVATLAALCYAIWMVLIWVGREVVIPVRDKLLNKGVTVLDRMDSSISSLQDLMERTGEKIERSLAILDRIEASDRTLPALQDLMERTGEKIERSLAILDRIEASDRTLPARTADECRQARSAVQTRSIDAALGSPLRPKENP